jgi:anti-anti-sigma factor
MPVIVCVGITMTTATGFCARSARLERFTGNAVFTAKLKSSVAVISAHGAIDASNADTLSEYTLRHVTGCRGLILDMSGLDFFDTEGFSALHTISACCAHAGTSWAAVPGGAVSRVLRVCGPNAWLPAADTIEAALAKFGRVATQGSALGVVRMLT